MYKSSYFVSAGELGDYMVWAGRNLAVDCKDGAHVVSFDEIRNHITSTNRLDTDKYGNVVGTELYTGTSARIIASLEAHRKDLE